jgi:hypothetical protein
MIVPSVFAAIRILFMFLGSSPLQRAAAYANSQAESQAYPEVASEYNKSGT